ncbi:hypothetical protein Aph01nite_22330 [Acrocarpospora phusangensis]|uniref:DUF4352 domain-containing protein n=1 Tax=Acrocarpospora phusangensis TaxID=1070424 RepID=A0A919QAQ2_9ACTN|nr:hypothetical protein Aph01nite_22330 [Acrocarpospora phusangensis]
MVVELRLKNTGATVFDDAPGNGLKLIDTEGQHYTHTFGGVKEGVVFSSVTANPGDSRKSVVLFGAPGRQTREASIFAEQRFHQRTGAWAIP